MPIRFRCAYCNRLLGIATRKAGTETTCPHCGYTITVPIPTDDDAQTERVNLDDVDEMLGNVATERVVEPGTQLVPPAVAAPRPAPPPVSKPAPSGALSLSPDAPPAPKARSAPPPVPKAAPKPAPRPSDDPPLFEGDVDELLGVTATAAEADRAKPPPTSGQDAMSLGEPPRMLVISSQKATLLMGLVVVLLALAFAAGYFLAK